LSKTTLYFKQPFYIVTILRKLYIEVVVVNNTRNPI